MPRQLQARLLRVLQERQVTRLGGTAAIALDVRVVAATAADLRLAIAERRFREDLYYRIATFQLKPAPLARPPGYLLPLAPATPGRPPAPARAPLAITPHPPPPHPAPPRPRHLLHPTHLSPLPA